MRNLSLFFRGLLLISLCAVRSAPFDATEPAPSTNVRESILVQIAERREFWVLEWKSAPEPYCPPAESSLTCTCIGFAYGQRGKLQLTRAIGQHAIETLDLGQFFGPSGLATVQKWDVSEDDGNGRTDPDTLADRVRRRPTVKIMQLRDFNHDGMATKFFLQTDVAPCGKILGVAVGITSHHPHLQALGSVLNPGKPLVLNKRAWDALFAANGEATFVDRACFDHGSQEQTELTLKTKDGAISVESRDYACNDDGTRGEFLRSQAL